MPTDGRVSNVRHSCLNRVYFCRSLHFLLSMKERYWLLCVCWREYEDREIHYSHVGLNIWARACERSLFYKHVFVATPPVLLICVDKIEICFTILYVFIVARAYILCFV